MLIIVKYFLVKIKECLFLGGCMQLIRGLTLNFKSSELVQILLRHIHVYYINENIYHFVNSF